MLTLEQLTFDVASDFAFRMLAGTSGSLTVVTSHHAAAGLAVTSAAGSGAALVTTLLLSGGATFSNAGRTPRRLMTGEVWRSDGATCLNVRYDPGTTFTDIVLPLSAVADAAAAAGGRRGAVGEDSDGRPVVTFVTSRPFDDDAERYWAALTRAAVQQVVRPQGPPASPLLREHLTRTLAAAALLVYPTSTIEHVRGPGFSGPATVRRALEHLHAHAGDPLTVSDLAAAAGVGVRGLQHAFTQHLGVTPTTYLLQVRLERAHADLVAGDPGAGDTVAAVAARWGFGHLGRFAGAYRARYDVMPSTTLRA